MKYHLICGYKRSGKDTFFKKIISCKLKEYLEPCSETEEPFFYILTNPGHTGKEFEFFELPPVRVALADLVKKEVNEDFKIKFHSLEAEEIAKDSFSFYDVNENRYRTLREYYIERAMKKRQEDPNHWCKKALESAEKDKELIITDWRFLNERIFFENQAPSITYRIFRSETMDTNFDDETEHSLDKEITDFLVVKTLEDIEIAKERFPQYKNFTIKFVLY